METFIIVEDPSKRYHIYNGVRECMAICSSTKEVCTYIHEFLSASSYTSYTFKFSAFEGMFIVTFK